MKRKLLITLLVLVMVILAACSKDSSSNTSAEEPAESASEAQPTKVTINMEEPTATPKPEAAEGSYEETFDEDSGNWSDPVFVTTQASGRDPITKVGLESGALRFAIDDLETYVYEYYLYGVTGDVTIDVDYQVKGAVQAGLAVVCKANDDLSQWYEVRVTAMDNNVNYYLYDKARRNEGKNPYLLLGKTHLDIKEMGPTKPNNIKVTCTDTEIKVDVNNGTKVASQELDTSLDGAIVGIGGMSYDTLPVKVDVDSVVIMPGQ